MNKMLVAVFNTEDQAFEGLAALKALHDDGDITVYATAVLVKDRTGKLSVRQAADEGPAGTFLGMLTGGLIGVIGGPVGIPIGAAIGGLTGMAFDLDRAGTGETFFDDVAKALAPGKAAVIADIDETWTAPVNARLHKQGGMVFRRLRSEVVEDQLNREAAAFQAELKALQDELRQAAAEDRAALQKDIDAVQDQLKVTRDRAKARLEAATAEMEARVKELQGQAKGARDRAKARIDKRIADTKADFAVRSKKLNQAWSLTKEALSSARAAA
jgi:uncharacterized membrane protein